jgi:aconitate hydratase
MIDNPFARIARREIALGSQSYSFYSLRALEEHGIGKISQMPLVLRIVLESVLRNCDGQKVFAEQVRSLASWQPNGKREKEIPFTVGRIVLNCAAGIPLLGDLTAMRGAVKKLGLSSESVGPKVPVDMVLDHTLTVDFQGASDAMARNMGLDIRRNEERYRFVKWAMQAYRGIRLFPPGAGILHQINLEFLAPGFLVEDGVCFPDTLVGTDSHTSMIAGLGAVGWGVGGIEAQAALLGEPLWFLTPDVIGVHTIGVLREGVTSTDVVLHVTEKLRKANVVGKFVEFFGEGVGHLTVPDRATIANMAPEYGATIGYFPVDEQTCRYLLQTGRSQEHVNAVEKYYREQICFGAPSRGEVDYSEVLEFDLSAVEPCVAGPKRPQDRVPLRELKSKFKNALRQPVGSGGYGRNHELADGQDQDSGAPAEREPQDGDVVIAAITSCTNTSNPEIMLIAGLLAKKAVEAGLRTKPWVKTSLTPGSLVVGEYLQTTGLQRYLDDLGFAVAGFSCATCVGNSGPIDHRLEKSISVNATVACAVLSGNRNFEGRIHPSVRAAFLASPPLVVAFALVGHVNVNLESEPIGRNETGRPVYLRDIWPTPDEVDRYLAAASETNFYKDVYSSDVTVRNPNWGPIPYPTGETYPWDDASSYIKEPPFLLDGLRTSALREFRGARAIVILGDSVTTDHISPIGDISRRSPAGLYLQSLGVTPADFNSYGSRRMNHHVMTRGAFANVRLRNFMVPELEGGFTVHHGSGECLSIYDAAMRYAEEQIPLIVVAGEEYGTGSARDWAAKATRLLGIRAVLASSFERIHRSNLVGMGVLPLQFRPGVTARTLGLDGSEVFDLRGLNDDADPGQEITLLVHRSNGLANEIPVRLRADTAAEMAYLRAGGIMPHMLNELTKGAQAVAETLPLQTR